jgi:hypothetical protein
MSAQKGIGRLIQVGVAKESTRGTAISSAASWNPWSDLTLDEKKEFVTDDQSYGIIEDNTNLTQTKKWAQGSLAGNVADQTIGLILYSLFGTHAVSGSGPYTHTFSIAETAQHQSLTFFKHDPLTAVDYSYANGVVEKLELSIALKKFVMFTASLVSQSGVSQSSFTPSTTTENRFVPQYLAAKFALNYAGLQGTYTVTGTTDGATAAITAVSNTALLKVGMTVSGTGIPANSVIVSVDSSTQFTINKNTTASGSAVTLTLGPVSIALKSAKITINQNVESQDVLGSLSPVDFLNKEFSVEGTLEAILQNESDFKTQFMGATPVSMRLDLVNTDAIAGGSTHPELYVDLPKVTLQEYGTPYKVKDLTYQNMKFKASYSISDTLLAKAVLINSVTTY